MTKHFTHIQLHKPKSNYYDTLFLHTLQERNTIPAEGKYIPWMQNCKTSNYWSNTNVLGDENVKLPRDLSPTGIQMTWKNTHFTDECWQYIQQEKWRWLLVNIWEKKNRAEERKEQEERTEEGKGEEEEDYDCSKLPINSLILQIRQWR